jgi:histidinol-phosphatase (PHP family)
VTIEFASDIHIHSIYSDGSGSVSDIAKCAVEKGLTSITFTDHMPLPFKANYAMDMDKIAAYRDEIKSLRKDYAGRLQIKMGLEIEYVPELESWIEAIVAMVWDHLIVSVHCLYIDNRIYVVNGNRESFDDSLHGFFQGDMEAFCRRYYQTVQRAVKRGWFDIVGHLDVIKKFNENQILFSESEPWYRELILQTLDTMKKHNMMMEMNMSGYHHPVGEPYPSIWIIKAAREKKIPIVLGSDAHKVDAVGQHFQVARDLF